MFDVLFFAVHLSLGGWGASTHDEENFTGSRAERFSKPVK